jgi:hypothetical protein
MSRAGDILHGCEHIRVVCKASESGSYPVRPAIAGDLANFLIWSFGSGLFLL